MLAAVYAAQPSLSTDLTRPVGDATTGDTTNFNLTDDFTGLRSEIFPLEEFCYSPKFNDITSESDDDSVQSVVNSQNGTKCKGQTDLGTSVTGGCEDGHSLEGGPNEFDDSTLLTSLSPLQDIENATVSSDSDRSDDINSATEYENELSFSGLDKGLIMDREHSYSSCGGNAQNSESDKSEESDGSVTESETGDSSCSTEESQSQGSDTDSNSNGSCSCGDSRHSSDDDKSDKNDSDDSETESESDSSSDESQGISSDSDSHGCGENSHNSDCNETDSNDQMTDSDSDSCSCISCCCSCEECCRQQ